MREAQALSFSHTELLSSHTEFFIADRTVLWYAGKKGGDGMREEPARGGVRSVGKAMELLEVLLARRRPMSLGELTEAMGYPKSTVHALLATLRAYSAIEQREDGRYYLGVRLFECGCAVSEAWDITRAARPHLEQLAERTCASAFLSLLEGGTVISLDQCAASTGTGLQVVVEIGTRLPLHGHRPGKAAAQPAVGQRGAFAAVGGGDARLHPPHHHRAPAPYGRTGGYPAGRLRRGGRGV